VSDRSGFNNPQRKGYERGRRVEYVLYRSAAGIWAIPRRNDRRNRSAAGQPRSVRRDMEDEVATAMGALVWGSDTDGRGYVRLRQFAEIAGRPGDAARKLCAGGDSHSAQWISVEREPDADSVAIAGRRGIT